MPKYIVVIGSKDAGKTTSIRALWKRLGGKKLPNDPPDFHDILEYKGAKIGFHSWGDSVHYLDKHDGGIPNLEDERCDIIISAAKSKGMTQDYFIKRCKISDLYWVGKVWQADEKKSTEQAAKHIEILIDALI